MSVRLIVAVVVGVLVLYLLVSSAVVVTARRRLAARWLAVRTALSDRAAVASRLAETVGSYAGAEPAVTGLAGVTAARPTGRAGAGQGEEAERSLVAALRALGSLVRQFPELRGDPVHQGLQGQLEEVQKRLDAAAGAYGRAARQLNRRRANRLFKPAATLLRCRAAPSFDPGNPLV